MYTCPYIELWYDAANFQISDGFYPQVQPNANYQSIRIGFELDGSKWVQIDGPSIDGLDCDSGRDLLYDLNELTMKNARQIRNKAGHLIFPKPK